jgi:uncharacterized protein YbjQ (UPF0145 family)
MIVATCEQLADRKLLRTLGLVRGSAVRSRHAGRDLIAWLRNMVGGEIPEYTKMLAETREQALDRMLEEARSLGANGVVGVRFSTSSPAGGRSEVLVYGTAVVYEDTLLA